MKKQLKKIGFIKQLFKTSAIVLYRPRSYLYCLSLSLLSIILFSYYHCEPPSDTSFDNPVIDQRDIEPGHACITLEKITYDGNFGETIGDDNAEPELYGRVCGATSENEALLDDKHSVIDRLQDCKNFFFVKDSSPLDAAAFGEGTATIGLLDTLGLDLLPEEAEDLFDSYKGSTDAPTTFASGKKEKDISISHKLIVADKLNHFFVIVFLPILDADIFSLGGTDKILSPSYIKNDSMPDDNTDRFTFQEGENQYPGIYTFKWNEVAFSGKDIELMLAGTTKDDGSLKPTYSLFFLKTPHVHFFFTLESMDDENGTGTNCDESTNTASND